MNLLCRSQCSTELRGKMGSSHFSFVFFIKCKVPSEKICKACKISQMNNLKTVFEQIYQHGFSKICGCINLTYFAIFVSVFLILLLSQEIISASC